MNEMAGRYQGRQFGNYQLFKLIGAGGSSEVYLGKHLYLGTEAALKILDTRLKDNEFAQFSNEARTLINLHHPNIVGILEFGMEAGIPFIVMQYAPHGSLGQRHPAGTRLPVSVVVSYVKSIALALQYAHEKNLVHRDIKPDNLLVGSENELLLSDFGIAVVAHNTHSLRTQDAIGTVTYMAPEQLRKKARPASDQYALGIVVYEWLCGEPPFDGSPIEVAMQHLNDPPRPLREKLPEITPAVERVVLKALAKEPHQRFTSVQEFAEALAEASRAGRETVRETPKRGGRNAEAPSSRLRKNLLSTPGKAALLTLLLLVILGAISGNNILSSLKRQPITTILSTRSTSPVHVSPGITPTAPGVFPNGASTGWTMFGFDAQHTEYNALERTLKPPNIPNLQTAWTSYTGYSLHPPVVANGVLYITTSENVASPGGNAYPVSTLYALDSQTSKVLWKKSNLPVQAGGQSLYDDSTSDIYTVAVANGVVYAAAVSGMLDALDARTGAQIWSTRITDAVLDTYQNAAPIVVNGTLYLHTINGNVYAVNARSGTVRWSTHVDVPTTPRNGGASIPAEANGVVYVGGSQYLYALEARNGTMLWRGAVNSWDPFTPVVAEGIVYAAADTGNVFAFNASGCGMTLCSPLWNSSFGLPESTGAQDQINYPPAVANGVLYVGTVADSVFGGGYLFAVDARTGARLWNASIDSTGVQGEGGVYASPVVANGVVYVIGQDGQFYTFRATGCGSATCNPFWTAGFRNNFGPGYSVTVLDGRVYLTTPGGTLYALRLP
ncbi:MAG TPA: serine/threonine-protein kinase [Ktedonobacteraceae bacterium]